MMEALIILAFAIWALIGVATDRRKLKKPSGRTLRLSALALVVPLLTESFFLYRTLWPFLPDAIACALVVSLTGPMSFEPPLRQRILVPLLSGLSLAVFALPRIAGWESTSLHTCVLFYTILCTAVLAGVGVYLWVKSMDILCDIHPALMAELWYRVRNCGLLLVGEMFVDGMSRLPGGKFWALIPGGGLLALFIWQYVASASRFVCYPLERLVRRSEKPLSKEAEKEYYDMIYKKCCRFMETKKSFLVEAFSLSDLAEGIFTNKSYVSKAINLSTEHNFRRFVNRYRVQYAQELFKKNKSLKVVELSMMSGCHSVQTFCAVFKVFTGVTPRVWCDRVRKMP